MKRAHYKPFDSHRPAFKRVMDRSKKGIRLHDDADRWLRENDPGYSRKPRPPRNRSA